MKMSWNAGPLIEELIKENRVISLVGSGGKTTLLCFLAMQAMKIPTGAEPCGYAEGAAPVWKACGAEFVPQKMSRKRRVLMTTTTKLYLPKRRFLCETEEDCAREWRSGRAALLGRPAKPGEGDVRKLCAPEPELLTAMIRKAECSVIEADGARMLPMKYPAAHEPALHPETDAVLAVIGMSALGQRLCDCCFRWALSGLPGEHRVTEEDVVRLLASEQGGRKAVARRRYLAVLNQCDTEQLQRSAERILRELRERYGIAGLWSAFSAAEREEGQYAL